MIGSVRALIFVVFPFAPSMETAATQPAGHQPANQRAVRPLVKRGLLEPGWALLETGGRRSGRRRVVPVGNGLREGVFWIVTEHGYRACGASGDRSTTCYCSPSEPSNS
jgi:hypothetical protein